MPITVNGDVKQYRNLISNIYQVAPVPDSPDFGSFSYIVQAMLDSDAPVSGKLRNLREEVDFLKSAQEYAAEKGPITLAGKHPRLPDEEEGEISGLPGTSSSLGKEDVKRLALVLNMADKNKDGKVSSSELLKLKNQRSAYGETILSTGRNGKDPLSNYQFQEISNGSGKRPRQPNLSPGRPGQPSHPGYNDAPWRDWPIRNGNVTRGQKRIGQRTTGLITKSQFSFSKIGAFGKG